MEWEKLIKAEDLGEPYNCLRSVLSISEIVTLAQMLRGFNVWITRKAGWLTEASELVLKVFESEKTARIEDCLSKRYVNGFIYFPDIKNAAADKIKKLVKSEYKGYNVRQLSQKYGYTERTIRLIADGKTPKNAPLEDQITLFE